MLTDSVFAGVNVIGAAMQASALRNEVTLNNIANVDTPGFTKKVVDFEESLNQALSFAGSLENLDLSSVSPRIRNVHSSFDYRIDGNNVDLETEMVELYQNSVRYDTMASGIISIFKRFNAVLQIR